MVGIIVSSLILLKFTFKLLLQAAEYMQQLPANKLPISGSAGAQYRRQQLERQIPLHDLTPNMCHDLSASEIQR